jgi:1-acyl-sn-glycerol-3-phosphate acyltransferase
MSLFVTMARTIVTSLVGVLATLVAAPVVMVIAAVNDSSGWIERVIRMWSRVWLSVSGTHLTVVGPDNIRPGASYVVVANHQSTLDIMACFLAVPLPIRYLAKRELFRIPILAQGMRSVGIIEVDRSARSAIHRQVNEQSQQLIAKGRSLIIYPEGTRPRDGALYPFKKGAFTMAIASQLPVLPVSIHGTYEAWEPGTLWVRGGQVTVVVDEPIPTTGMTQQDANELTKKAYEVIANRVAEMGGRIAV